MRGGASTRVMGAVKKILGQAWRLQVMLTIHAFHGPRMSSNKNFFEQAAAVCKHRLIKSYSEGRP